MNASLDLPKYSGSILRSAFGMALRQISCITGHSTCCECQFISNCAYSKIIESESHARAKNQSLSLAPYVIEPEIFVQPPISSNKKFRFHFILMGSALKHLPLVVFAWQRVLAFGVGKNRITGELVKIYRSVNGSEDLCIWKAGQTRIVPHELTTNLNIPAEKDDILLYFDTPLRLQRKGKILGTREVSPADLLAGCLRRFQAVAAWSEEKIDAQKVHELTERAKSLVSQSELKYVNFSRYSSRQKQKMDLPGLVGYWRIQGNLKPFLPALYLCEIVHIGKNTSIGLGKYMIDPLQKASDSRETEKRSFNNRYNTHVSSHLHSIRSTSA